MEMLLGDALSVLEAIPESDKLEMLAKGRFSCESRWMMMMVAEAGWEKANEYNRAVAEAVGYGEMSRLIDLAGTGRPSNHGEFMRLVLLARQLFLPDKYFEASFARPAEDVFTATMRRCIAHNKVSSLGLEDRYECGCFAMRRGWYRAMGVEVSESLGRCLLDGDEYCEVTGRVLSFGGETDPA